MDIVSWSDFLQGRSAEERNAAVTIGVFDGMHIGHQVLAKRINVFAGTNEKIRSVVFTFSNNPMEFLNPESFLGNVSTLEQKIDYFRAFGLDSIVLIDFSAHFSKLTGNEFFSLLEEHMEIVYVCLGKNFHCGKDNDTNSTKIKNLLEPKGINVDIVKQIPYQGKPVSSTRIRKELHQGNIQCANAMLGRDYELDYRRREKNEGQIVPKDGRYKVKLIGEKQSTEYIKIKNREIQFPAHWENEKNIEKIQFIDRIAMKGEKNGSYR